MTSFFEHQRTSYKRNYLRNLITLAFSDGNIGDEERMLIHTIGVKRGLKQWQIDELLSEKQNRDFFIPESVSNRMNLLFDVMQIVYADGKVTEGELKFIQNLIGKLQLKPEITGPLLDLFSTHTPTLPEWNDFLEHVVGVESRRSASAVV